MAKDIINITLTSDYVVDGGKARINKKFWALFLQGILAGLFIALGAIAYIKISSLGSGSAVTTFLAAAIFPTGIIMILVTGAELFTSNTMIVMGAYNKDYKYRSVIRVLLIVWIANLVGSVCTAAITTASGIFSDAMIDKISHIAEAKTSMQIGNMIWSSILCNIIVCTGVWTAYAIKSAGAKILALWFVITVFVLSGTEHIVANMFYLSGAYFMGADITIGGIFYNFAFVTLGNLIGGVLIVTGIKKTIVSRMKEPA